jgi:hypothetical protein
MKNYFEEFYKRYEDLKGDLVKSVGDLSSDENLKKAISSHHQLLNNIVMAGLGMGTLYLRMGAVLMIAEKTKEGLEPDVSFLKVIADKLIHKLPADGDWLEIWKKFLETEKQCKWNEIISKSAQPDIHSAFVSLRNDIAHQEIIISPFCELSQIQKTLKILDGMTSFRILFEQSIISTENNEVYFQYSSNEEKLKISPYVQINKSNEPEEVGILPYLFQGRYYAGAKFINTEGTETNAKKDESVDDTFEKIKSEIARFNGDKAFDFDEKIKTYNDWCIGREDEINAIKEWITKETDKNVLPIFAPAGLGKGALVAELIKNLKENKSKHLFHFCGSGAANNLQAILYSLIIQGKENKYWNAQSLPEKFKNKLERLPSQYTDVIELFQALLMAEKEITEIEISKSLNNPNPDGRFNAIYDLLIKMIQQPDNDQLEEILNQYFLTAKQLIDTRRNKLPIDYYHYIFDIHFSLTKYGLKSDLLDLVPENHRRLSKKYFQPLVIIIDGLDEAAVADHSKRISDWFYIYDEKGERKEKWISLDHIKWIFTYRQTTKDNKDGFQFDYHEFNTHDLPLVQPLKGLTEEAVKKGIAGSFKKHEPSLTKEFIDTIIKKGAVK